MGIQFLHRLGALAVIGIFAFIAVNMRKKTGEILIRKRLFLVGSLMVAQILLGINHGIFSQLHPLVSLLHSAGAIAIFTTLTFTTAELW